MKRKEETWQSAQINLEPDGNGSRFPIECRGMTVMGGVSLRFRRKTTSLVVVFDKTNLWLPVLLYCFLSQT